MEKIIEIIADVLEEDAASLSNETKLQDLDAWDSMTHMFLITRIEKDCNIRLENEEIVRMTDVASIIDVVSKKGA